METKRCVDSTVNVILTRQTCGHRGPDQIQTKMQESHSGLWDVGIAESQDSHRSFLNAAVGKFSVEQQYEVSSFWF